MLIVKGLKCDSCDYKDMNIDRILYKLYIGTPCPKCGAPLLTQKDYDAILLLEKLSDYSDSISGPRASLKINMNGNGFEGMRVELV